MDRIEAYGLVANDGTEYDVTTESGAEVFCRDFAREYPTDNTLMGVKLAEQGKIPWVGFAKVCVRALREALATVRA